MILSDPRFHRMHGQVEEKVRLNGCPRFRAFRSRDDGLKLAAGWASAAVAVRLLLPGERAAVEAD